MPIGGLANIEGDAQHSGTPRVRVQYSGGNEGGSVGAQYDFPRSSLTMEQSLLVTLETMMSMTSWCRAVTAAASATSNPEVILSVVTPPQPLSKAPLSSNTAVERAMRHMLLSVS